MSLDPGASRLDTPSSIVSSIESRVSRIKSRVSSIKFESRKLMSLTLERIEKLIACMNLVKFTFKSFVSCNLQFQAFYIRNSMVYRSIFRACKKPSPGQVVFLFGQETFCPSSPDGQRPRQAVRRLNFW